MSRRTRRMIRKILKNIDKYLKVLCCLFSLSILTLGILKLVYETGILLVLDTILGLIFG